MKNNKGFTMIELLAVIVILGILSIMAIVGVSSLIDKSKKEDAIQSEKTLKMAAESYYQTNQSELPKAIGEKKRIDAAELKTKKYLKQSIKDSKGNDCTNNSYVLVYKESTTEYSYETYLCGKEVEKSKSEPTITAYFTDNDNKKIDDKKTLYKNLKQAKLYMVLKGGEEDGKKIAIDGYSYIIYAKTEDEAKFTEVFNSGTLSANGSTEITVDRKITDYLDVTGRTDFRINITVINKKGVRKTEKLITTGKDDISIEGFYNDDVKPICSNISGEAEANEWINKSSSKKNRTITATCSDGEGSGCIRNTFSRTWPNDYQKTGAEYSYIQVVDNAQNKSVEDSFVTAKNPCDVSVINTSGCRVRVNVDVASPTVTIRETPLKTKKVVSEKNTVVLEDEIKADSYKKSVNNWLNAANYPEGIKFTIDLSDDIHLASYTWEVNEANLKTTVNNKDIKFDKKSSENASKKYGETESNKNCGPLKDTITIGFKAEGKRQGRLTVVDKAGNKTVVYITAFLDRTKPTVPTTNLFKWKADTPKPTSSTGLKGYTEDTWHKGKVFTKASGATDSMSGVSHYEYIARGATTPTTTPTKAPRNIEAEGISHIAYRTVDIAGNASAFNKEKTVKLDRSPPTVPAVNMYKWKNNTAPTKSSGLSSYSNDTWLSGKVYTEHGPSTDKYSGNAKIGDPSKIYYQYTTTGKTENKKNQTANYRNVEAQGVSYIVWRACDPLGNCSANSAKKTIKLDRTDPSCKIKKTITYSASGVTVKVSCSDGISGISSCPGTRSGLKSNKTYSTRDNAGNSSSCSVSIYSTRQYRYIQKVNKTCKIGSCCGWYTETRRSCKKCGSETKCKSSAGFSCPSGWSKTGRYCPGWTSGAVPLCSRCSECTYNTDPKECTKACCGKKCGTAYGSWGGKNTGCTSDWRYLYY